MSDDLDASDERGHAMSEDEIAAAKAQIMRQVQEGRAYNAPPERSIRVPPHFDNGASTGRLTVHFGSSAPPPKGP